MSFALSFRVNMIAVIKSVNITQEWEFFLLIIYESLQRQLVFTNKIVYNIIISVAVHYENIRHDERIMQNIKFKVNKAGILIKN